ncbi:MAG: hypothetical protein EHM41_00235 [Chloroflexi bacterium]|nr:MAG: hypothetical protein EHM41_00235 [Chloroflexota bacterium]
MTILKRCPECDGDGRIDDYICNCCSGRGCIVDRQEDEEHDYHGPDLPEEDEYDDHCWEEGAHGKD